MGRICSFYHRRHRKVIFERSNLFVNHFGFVAIHFKKSDLEEGETEIKRRAEKHVN